MAEFDNFDQPVVCVTHSDLDGMAAAAVVKRKYKNAKIFYSNYGRPTPPQAFINGAKLFVTDFSLPELEFEKAQRLGMDIIWIDHHLANYSKLEAVGFSYPGLRRDDASGALLTWKYIYPGVKPPHTLELVDDYDRWQFKFPETKAFNSGIQLFEQRVSFRNCYIWDDLLSDNENVVKKRLDIICDIGNRVNAFTEFKNKVMCRELSYITEFMGKKILVANTKQANSMFFDSITPETRASIDAVSVIQYAPDIQRYRGSFYSPDDCKLVIQLAQAFPGGGGHPKAAGFSTPDYPFPIQPSDKFIPMKTVMEAYQMMLKKREDVFANQAACRANRIALTAHTFKTTFLKQPSLVINHPYITDLIDGFFHHVDIINEETGEPYQYFVGYSLTRDGWYRVGFWSIDQSIANCNEIALYKTIVKNCGIEAEDFYEEKLGGFNGSVFWFYTKQLPLSIPIRR